MRVGIVIPVVNCWKTLTGPCVDSLRSRYDLRVVVVDNGSTDETPKMCRNLMLNRPGFYTIRNDINMGCAYAWNQGVKDCFEKGCEYVMVCNNDVLFHPKAIDNLVDRFEKARNRYVIKRDDSKIFSEFSNFSVDSAPPETSNLKITESDVLGMVTCMNIRGECPLPTSIFEKNEMEKDEFEAGEHPDFSAFMINKLCWEKAGEFDEGFSVIGKAFFEDNDYHYRINLAGLKAITNPRSIYYHFGSATQKEIKLPSVLRHLNFEKNRSYFIKKWKGMPDSANVRTPFEDSAKSLRWTWQAACIGVCNCNVKCAEIKKTFGY